MLLQYLAASDKMGTNRTTAQGNLERDTPSRAMQSMREMFVLAANKGESVLRDSEQRLRAIVDSAVDAIITIDQRGTIESANPATSKLFGYSEAELIGKNVKMLMPSPYSDEHDGYLSNYIRTGKAKIIGIGREVTGLRKDGTTFSGNLSVSQVHLSKRRLFTGIVHDLSERRRLEKQILEASTDEQRRIGQDLHDGHCQELVGIGFGMEMLARALDTKAPAEAELARKLGDSVRAAAAEARRLSHGLNPVDLKAGGLKGAFDNLAKKVTESFDIRCTCQCDPGIKVDDDATATHLYRIAQEAINNAIRHGKADRIEIRIAATDSSLTLTVTDNGIGLPAALYSDLGAGPTGMGMQTMRYRARMIGASFAIRPHSRRGTVVTCVLRRKSAANRRNPR